MTFSVKIYKTTKGFFQTKYLDPNTGERKRTRFHTLKEAKAHKEDLERAHQSKGLSAFNDLRVSQAVQLYLTKIPNSQIRDRKNHFTDFIEKFGNHRVSELSKSDMVAWFQGRKEAGNLSDRTMQHVKSQFWGFFEYLLDQDFTRSNPLERIKFKRYDTPRRHRVVLSVEEVLELLENAKTFSPDVLYPYLFTIAHTGARRGEVVRLTRADVDFKTGLIHLKQTKNGHQRFIRMAPSLSQLLADHLASHDCEHVLIGKETDRLTRWEIAKTINKFKHFFPNDKNWGCHSLRHSFAYNFLKKEGQMYQLQAILGHRTINTTVDLYAQLQAQDIENPSPYEISNFEKETA